MKNLKNLNHLKTYENYVKLTTEAHTWEFDWDDSDDSDDGGFFKGIIDRFRNKKQDNRKALELIDIIKKTFDPKKLTVYDNGYDDDCFFYNLDENNKIHVVNQFNESDPDSHADNSYTDYLLILNDEELNCSKNIIKQLLNYFISVKHLIPKKRNQ